MLNQKLGFIERLTSPTPSFFAKIRNFALLLAVMGGAIANIDSFINLPIWVVFLGERVVWVSGLVMALVAQLTVDYNAKAFKDAFSDKSAKGYFQ